MTFRQSTASLALFVLAADTAQAQPVAPARPTYSSYSSIIRPGGGGSYYGFGFNQPDAAAQVQNQLLVQQLNQTARTLNGIQTFLTTGVNPSLGVTGRGAVYNSLGHWYPTARTGGGGGIGGGFAPPTVPLMGNGMLRGSGLGGFGVPNQNTNPAGRSPATGGIGAPPTTGTPGTTKP